MTTLTDADIALRRIQLVEAETALHKLVIGRQAVVVEVDGRKVHYNKATMDELRGRIAQLTDEIAGRCVRYGAIGFWA